MNNRNDIVIVFTKEKYIVACFSTFNHNKKKEIDKTIGV